MKHFIAPFHGNDASSESSPGQKVMPIEWDYTVVLLSYLVSVQGAWTTSQVLYQVHKTRNSRHKNGWLALASISLGGCAIWGMHFVGKFICIVLISVYLSIKGMMALKMDVNVEHTPWLTVISFFIPVIMSRIAYQVSVIHCI
jgi:NO-binding membrane sensor protein with MHYT domain